MGIRCSGLVRVGPSGWRVDPPPRSVRRSPHPLEELADKFDLVEIAESALSMPRVEKSRVWVRRVEHNPTFQFTAQLHVSFTRDRCLDDAAAGDFRAGLAPLMDKGRLGAVLMRFPWPFRFTSENRDYLIRLRRALHPLPLTAEFLHASWSASEAIGTLIDYRIGFCNVDQVQQTKAMPPSSFLTSATGYVRLLGRGSAGSPYQYPDGLLNEWNGRVQQIASFADRVYVVAADRNATARSVAADRLASVLRERRPVRLAAAKAELPLLHRVDAIAVA